MIYIWKYFLDLDSSRLNNGYGPLPISYKEILAYFTIYKIDYDLIEIDIIKVLDNVAMEHYNSEIEKTNKKGK